MKTKTLAQLKKLFREKIDESQKIPSEKRMGYMDCANMCMVIPKTTAARDIIQLKFDTEPSKIPVIEYKEGHTAKFSIEYLMVFLELLKTFKEVEESVKISLANNMPLTLETKEFIFILAPRIDN